VHNISKSQLRVFNDIYVQGVHVNETVFFLKKQLMLDHIRCICDPSDLTFILNPRQVN
jgi:hypothetical protein